MFHRGGEHDLGAGAAVLLQMVDKSIQFLGGGEQHLDEHAVIPGNAAAFHHLGAALDIGVKLRLALWVHVQVDEGFDQIPHLDRVHLGLIPGQAAVFLQLGDAGGYGRGGQKHLVGNLFQRRTGVALQNVDDFAVDMVHPRIPPNLTMFGIVS